MGANYFPYTCEGSELPDDSKYHGAAKGPPPSVEEKDVFGSFLYFLMKPDMLPVSVDVFYIGRAYGNKALFVSLPGYLDKQFIEVEVRNS